MGGNGKIGDEKARSILERTITTQYDKLPMTTCRRRLNRAKENIMTYDSTDIISRIEWCRRQQQLYSITKDERAGWRAEEAGLVDALGCRDRIAFMREEHRFQFIRYQSGLEEGRALLRLPASTPGGMTRAEGLDPATLTTPAGVDNHLSTASSPLHVGESRR
jgi:hypothetical protein